MFPKLEKIKYGYYGLFDNIVISKLINDMMLEDIKEYTSGLTNDTKSEFQLPNNADGLIYGIPFYIDKYLPDNMLLLRDGEKIIDIIYL